MKLNLKLVSGFVFLILVNPAYTGAVPTEYSTAVELYQKGSYEESLNLIRSVFDDNKGSLELRSLAAANYQKLGNYESALSHMMYAMKEHPDKPEPALYYAELQKESGAPNRAIDMLRRTAGKFPNDPWVRYELAASFVNQKNYVEARKQLESIIAKNPNFFQAIYLDGLIYLIQGSYETADFRFNNALRIKINDSEWLKRLYNNLGLVNEKIADKEMNPQFKKEKLDSAKDYYKKALKIDQNYAIAKSNLDRVE
ncbi:MAG: tetratricopeptide repeat protein [Leptonema sp. (in: Bacteria)]|nr:tetratricopeptide repeat protein [Leptonema sp. (in: bacteria)]